MGKFGEVLWGISINLNISFKSFSESYSDYVPMHEVLEEQQGSLSDDL